MVSYSPIFIQGLNISGVYLFPWEIISQLNAPVSGRIPYNLVWIYF